MVSGLSFLLRYLHNWLRIFPPTDVPIQGWSGSSHFRTSLSWEATVISSVRIFPCWKKKDHKNIFETCSTYRCNLLTCFLSKYSKIPIKICFSPLRQWLPRKYCESVSTTEMEDSNFCRCNMFSNGSKNCNRYEPCCNDCGYLYHKCSWYCFTLSRGLQ